MGVGRLSGFDSLNDGRPQLPQNPVATIRTFNPKHRSELVGCDGGSALNASIRNPHIQPVFAHSYLTLYSDIRLFLHPQLLKISIIDCNNLDSFTGSALSDASSPLLKLVVEKAVQTS